MCAVTPPVVVTLPMDMSAPRKARQMLVDASCPVHHREVLEEARLLVSELVANAVRHGAPPITFRVECQGADGEDGLVVAVSDAGSEADIKRQLGDPAGEHGRGIALVDVMSDDWGVEPGGDGKTVWFRMKEHSDS